MPASTPDARRPAAQALLAALNHRVGCIEPEGTGVVDVERLSGGASQETWAFAVRLRDGRTVQRILRRMPEGDRPGDATAGPEKEARVIALARAAGVPAPDVRYVLTPSDGVGRGYVMDRIEGETRPAKVLRDARYAPARLAFAHQAGDALARIHAVDASCVGLRTGRAAEEVADLWNRYLRSGTARPVFEVAFRWLRANAPKPAAARLVHGDFRNGNLMFGPEGLRGVLDWELTHLGDPLEDLGWLCVNSWRFGEIDREAGGIARREDVLAAYEAASGTHVDRVAMRFWEVLGTLRWGIMCAAMVEWIESGLDASVERCMIARRASETELDLLNLLSPRVPRHGTGRPTGESLAG